MTDYFASYSCKDLILYALAIGCDSDEELRFLYEHHPRFEAVPTFPLVLAFWASQQKDRKFEGIPVFPPPMLKESMSIRRFLRSPTSVQLSKVPLIHVRQSIVWHRPIPVPSVQQDVSINKDMLIRTLLRQSLLSVLPKKVGTFVMNKTEVILDEKKSVGADRLLCTLESTTLLLGIPMAEVVSYQSAKMSKRKPSMTSHVFNGTILPTFEWQYTVAADQALHYRMASGDSNLIHVKTSFASRMGGNGGRALLHGLCTLGIVVRAILRYLQSRVEHSSELASLQCSFVKPVFVGDSLTIRIWDNGEGVGGLLFNVVNGSQRDEACANGSAVVGMGLPTYRNRHPSKL